MSPAASGSPARAARSLITPHRAAAAAIGLGYALLAAIRLDLPGPNYDELLYTNAALGSVDDWFVTERWFGRPVMLMSYIGALKAWIARPWFHLFGFSVTDARLLGILIAAIGLTILASTVLARAGRFAALAVVALATSPSLIELTRVDVGPSAIEFTLRCIAVSVLVRWVHDRRVSTRGALVLSACFLLGTFNKLNFLWSVAALLVVVAVGIPRSAFTRWPVVVLLGGMLASLGWYAYCIETFGPVAGGAFPSFTGIGARAETLTETTAGTWFQQWASTATVPTAGALTVGLTGLLLVGCAVTAIRRRCRTSIALLAGLAAVVAIVLLTEGAVRGWHALVVLPFLPLVTGGVGLHLSDRERRIAGGLVAAVIATQLWTYAAIVAHRDDGLNPYYSDSIVELERFTRLEGAPVLLSDWGIKGYLQAADHRAIYVELVWDPRPTLCRNLVVVRAPGLDFFAGSRESAFALGPMQLERTVEGRAGVEYELYRLDECSAE